MLVKFRIEDKTGGRRRNYSEIISVMLDGGTASMMNAMPANHVYAKICAYEEEKKGIKYIRLNCLLFKKTSRAFFSFIFPANIAPDTKLSIRGRNPNNRRYAVNYYCTIVLTSIL